MELESTIFHATDAVLPRRARGDAPATVDLDSANEELAESSAVEVVQWAAATFGRGLALSSSFGAQSAVMLHLVTRIVPELPVVFIDTGHLFPETYRFAESLRERLQLRLVVCSPQMTTARQEALYGKLWDQGEAGVRRYLEMNKVEPMQRALRDLGVTAWMAGLRGSQTEHRRSLRKVELQDGRVKIHPILDWSAADVEAYLQEHDLPRHPLYDQGYRSIGDVHSTWPVAPEEDERAGRMLGVQKECGLHLPLTREQNLSLGSAKL